MSRQKRAIFIYGFHLKGIQPIRSIENNVVAAKANAWMWLNMFAYWHELDIQFDYIGHDQAGDYIDDIVQYDYVIFYPCAFHLRCLGRSDKGDLSKLMFAYNMKEISTKVRMNGGKMIAVFSTNGGRGIQLLKDTRAVGERLYWPQNYLEYVTELVDGVIHPLTNPYYEQLHKDTLGVPCMAMPPHWDRKKLDDSYAIYSRSVEWKEFLPTIPDIEDRWMAFQIYNEDPQFYEVLSVLRDQKVLGWFYEKNLTTPETQKILEDNPKVHASTTQWHPIWALCHATTKGYVADRDDVRPMSRATLACLMGNKPCIATGGYQEYFYPNISFLLNSGNIPLVRDLINKDDFSKDIDFANHQLDTMLVQGSEKLNTFLKQI